MLLASLLDKICGGEHPNKRSHAGSDPGRHARADRDRVQRDGRMVGGPNGTFDEGFKGDDDRVERMGDLLANIIR